MAAPPSTPAPARESPAPVVRGPAQRAVWARPWTYIAVFALLFFAYTYVHQYRMWNQHSRLDLLHAIFVHDTLQIDAYHENTGDKAFFEGHYYSDKAPGIALLALPSFALGVAILEAKGLELDSLDGWHFSDWFATAGSVSLLTALGGIAVFATLRRFVAARDAFVATLIVFLGTGMFPYATTLFAHSAVAALLAIAIWALVWPRGLAPPKRSQAELRQARVRHLVFSRETLAGAACGLAVASEFPAALPVAALLLYVALQRFGRAVHVGLAAIPTFLVVPANNWITFGSPLTFGYSEMPVFPQMRQGVFGVGPPTWDGLYVLLVSPHRGLFFWSPFLLLVFAGYVRLWRTSRPIFLLFFGVPLAQTIAMSGFIGPDGGAALGPRYIVLITPFLAVPAALGFTMFRSVGAVLAVPTLLLMGGATLISAQPPQTEKDVLNRYYLPQLEDGELVYNLGSTLGLPGLWSVLPLVVVATAGSIMIWRRLPADVSAPHAAASTRGARPFRPRGRAGKVGAA